jgi:hypothetical protein
MAHSSIGNMSNTLIETGARHMQQCRTNYDVLLSLAGDEENELVNNAHRWEMAKDELAVCCNKNLFPGAPRMATKYAYPSVITCLGHLNDKGDCPDRVKLFLACYYQFVGQFTQETISAVMLPTDDEKKDNKSFKSVQLDQDHNNKAPVNNSPDIAKQLRQFTPVGYSVTPACAHAETGDTVGSVQIGGLRTVLNGGFDVQTGDLVQMYIPHIESFLFDPETGGRIFVAADSTRTTIEDLYRGQPSSKVSDSEQNRRNFYSRGDGVKGGIGSTQRNKNGVFSIKPYIETANEFGLQYSGDKTRVFARAISSARPYEPVDIMIARQSL